jgi:hypothetical protein
MKQMRLMRYRLEEDGAVIGMILDHNGRFVCYTLEGTKTLIPKGIYRVEYRTEGSLNEKYRVKFKDFHKGMLWIRNIPNFEYVYLHIGNTTLDSRGCPLVGFGDNTDGSGKLAMSKVRSSISFSNNAYRYLYGIMSKIIDMEGLELRIIDLYDILSPDMNG